MQTVNTAPPGVTVIVGGRRTPHGTIQLALTVTTAVEPAEVNRPETGDTLMMLNGSLATVSDQVTRQSPRPLPVRSISLGGPPGCSSIVPPAGFSDSGPAVGALAAGALAAAAGLAAVGVALGRSADESAVVGVGVALAGFVAAAVDGVAVAAADDADGLDAPAEAAADDGVDAAAVAAAAATPGGLGSAAGGTVRPLPVSANATATMIAAITIAAVTTATPCRDDRSDLLAPPAPRPPAP